MEREEGECLVNTNALIGFSNREKNRAISNKIESWIKLKMADDHGLGPDDQLLLARFNVGVSLLGMRQA